MVSYYQEILRNNPNLRGGKSHCAISFNKICTVKIRKQEELVWEVLLKKEERK
jgi:aerobic-type carbon monoxide dehydrogenase small subunit (CoxS/CutS family)